MEQAIDGRFVVLNDEPVEKDDEDLLDTADTARGLADLITGSRVSTPFSIAIDAGLGMGKSSLMRLLRSRLEGGNVPTVWFNAWTSGPDVLEVLIKSVLLSFDRNVVRRGYHRLTRRRRAMGVVRVGLALVVSFFGLRRLVDGLWSQLSVDAKSRGEIREVVREMAGEWAHDGKPDGRQLVVFVDDLDRCPHDVVHAVCEAIKLYLDVPGLVFVIGCDQVALAHNLRDADGSGVQAVEYLEKIIQVNYRAPVPDPDRLHRLIRGYAEKSGTGALFDAQLTSLVAERTKWNPRRIKRLINSFVLEYHLDSTWQRFGALTLVRVVLLQHFYPGFYRLLASPDGRDPVGEFLDYVSVWSNFRFGRLKENDRWQEVFASHGLEAPGPGDSEEQRRSAISHLEEELPLLFPELASDHEFVSLLSEINADTDFPELRGHLQRRSRSGVQVDPGASVMDGVVGSADFVQTGSVYGSYNYYPPVSPSSYMPATGDLSGLRVLWIDDKYSEQTADFSSDDSVRRELLERGAVIRLASDLASARAVLRDFSPDLVISDITRFGDESAGLNDLRALRESDGYRGEALFFTLRITPSRVRRAKELGAELTADPREVINWVGMASRRLREPS